MSKRKEYGIFDGDELAAMGSSEFMRGMFGIWAHQYAYSGKLYKNKYHVKMIGPFTENKIISDSLDIRQHKKDIIDMAVVNMKKYGNTIARDPEDFRRAMEENGIEFTCRLCSDGVGYILERI